MNQKNPWRQGLRKLDGSRLFLQIARLLWLITRPITLLLLFFLPIVVSPPPPPLWKRRHDIRCKCQGQQQFCVAINRPCGKPTNQLVRILRRRASVVSKTTAASCTERERKIYNSSSLKWKIGRRRLLCFISLAFYCTASFQYRGKLSSFTRDFVSGKDERRHINLSRWLLASGDVTRLIATL